MTRRRGQAWRGLLLSLAVLGCDASGTPDPPDPADIEGRAAPEVVARVRGLSEPRTGADETARRLELAMVLDANALTPEACAAYEAVVGRDPSACRAWYHLAVNRAALGDVEAALAALAECLRCAPDYGPAHWRRGLWLLELGRVAEARAAFEAAAELPDGATGGRLGLARVALEDGRAADARDAMLALLAEQPGNRDARRFLARAWLQLGENEKARAEQSRAVGPRVLWRDDWRAEVAERRAGYHGHMDAARELIARGELEGAVAPLEMIRAAHPADVAAAGMLAAVLADAGESERALAVLREVADLRPDHYLVELNLAQCVADRGDVEAALAHVERAIALHPLFAKSHLLRGHLLVRARRLEESTASFREAIRLGERGLELFVKLARIEMDLARFGEAAATLERAVDLHPGAADPLVLLASARAELGDARGAREAWESAAALAPDHPLLPVARAKIERIDPGGEGR